MFVVFVLIETLNFLFVFLVVNSVSAQTTTIKDATDTNLIAFRRTIYLTIMSSLDFEECVHKVTNFYIIVIIAIISYLNRIFFVKDDENGS